MKIRKFLAAALVIIMLIAAVPVLSLADGARAVTREARQMHKLDYVWAALDSAEAKALAVRKVSKPDVIQYVYQTALNIDSVDKDSFSDFSEDGFFFTVDGMACSYNYRLRNELTQGADAIPENECFVFVKGNGEATRAPQSPNVLLIGPYYGFDASFTDQYRLEAQSIANVTGGNFTLVQGVGATGPAIARNFTNKGVVLVDSHGVMNGNSTYICLTTSNGITVNDYNNGWAVRSGNSAYIDGRYIQNHVNRNLGDCFVWLAMCEGMRAEGGGTTGTALINAGAAAVYGYSQAVTFVSEGRYGATFWTEMKEGATVAEAMRTMKNICGEADPFGDPPAWPILMSAVDAFPENPDGPQEVNCGWTLIDPPDAAAITAVTLDNAEIEQYDIQSNLLTVQPADADYTVTWNTEDPSIAIVDEAGTVVALGVGTTTLFATVHDNVANIDYNRSSTITVISNGFGGWEDEENEIMLEPAEYIEDGGEYIIVADNSINGTMGYAVGNTMVSNNRYLTPVAVTMSGSRIVLTRSDISDISWIASGNAYSGYTFKNVSNSKNMGLDQAEYLYPSNQGVSWKYTSAGALDNQIDSAGYYYLSYSYGKYTTSKTSGSVSLYKVSNDAAPNPQPTYTVTFKDWDGRILKTQQVAYGKAATAPANPTRYGYTFAGWDRSFNYIVANTYVLATYTQNYNPNPTPVPTPTPAPAQTVSYELASYITPGEKYVIVAENSISGSTGYAVGNSVVSSNRYLNPVKVTVNSNGTLTMPAGTSIASITWYAGGSSYYGYTFRSTGNNRYMGLDSAQYLAPTTSSVAWKYSGGALDNQVDSDGYFFLSYSNGRYTTSKSQGNIRLYRVVEG